MRFFGTTHLGLIRTNNEDAFILDDQRFYAVADGVGGHNAGEIASNKAVQSLKKYFYELLLQGNHSAYALRRALSMVNKDIYLLSHSKPEYKGMSTTLTAVYFEAPDYAHILQIGDSRLYHWREGKLKQITQDQTLVGELLAAGKITQDEVKSHPKKGWLLQAVGSEKVIQAEIQRFELLNADKLLLCTDGLSNMLTEEEIAMGLSNNTPKECVENLLALALERGGSDNITMIVIDEFGKEDYGGRYN